MKIVAWIVLWGVLLIILGLAYYLIVGEIVFRTFLGRKSLSYRLFRKDINQALIDYKIDLCWWDKVNFQKVKIKSFDDLGLVGHLYDAKQSKTAIVVHGFGQDYREMQPYCKMFLEKGFNVLVVDNRGHGKSEGSIGLGELESRDVLSWVDFLTVKLPKCKIILFGLSMGGTAVCIASGYDLPNPVKAIISDCAFANADKQINHLLNKRKVFKVFKKHFYSYSKRVKGLDILKIDATKSVKNSKVPMLFVHGADDDFVPVENVYALSNSLTNRERFVVDGAKHAMSYPVAGNAYEKKISDFLKSRTEV